MEHEPPRQSVGHVSHDRFNWAMAGVVLSLLIQSAVLVAWGSKLDQRVEQLEVRTAGSEKLSETVARVDERTAGLVTTVNRIDQRLTDQERLR
ncbi:MAG: hypothetical protein ACOVKC_03415 [Brevundimonas sp.]